MATTNGSVIPSSSILDKKFSNEHQLIFMNDADYRSRNREQLIEKLERVIQEKNASISKLEEREQSLEDALRKKTNDLQALEERLRQFEEKTLTFEQLHQLQVQTFEKTIRDCQIENERLCEHINELTNQLREKEDLETIHQGKILTFDRIAADTQLWRQKLDSYKATIEERDQTILDLRREVGELQRRKQTNASFDDNSLRLQILSLQNSLRDREKEIEHLKSTLRHVRDNLEPSLFSADNRWKSCSDDLGRISPQTKSSSQRKRVSSPSSRDQKVPSSIDVEFYKKKIQTLTNRLQTAEQLIVKRDDQIATLKRVHDKRWLRLKHLQKQYRLIKEELQSYTEDEAAQKYAPTNSSVGRAIRKNKTGCSVCQEQRWKKQTGTKRKLFKQEDDDSIWNEVTKLRRENARLINENLSLHEKLDLQEVEINEQTIVIGELRNEIRSAGDAQLRNLPTVNTNATKDDQQKLIDEMDKKIYELETERTCLVFEQERLKTSLDLCLDEKQHLAQQRTQTTSEMKKLKLRVLALQDQLHKLRRSNLMTNKKNVNNPGTTINKRRIVKRSPKKTTPSKSCLEILLDQNQSHSIIDDLNDQSSILYRPTTRRNSGLLPKIRPRTCSLCDHHTETSLMKRKRRPSTTATVTRKRGGPFKKNLSNKSRLPNPFTHDSYNNYARKPISSVSRLPKGPTRLATLRKRIEQLEMELLDSKEENEQLNQRLSSTLSRVNILKNSNQRLMNECDKLKTDHFVPAGTSFSEHRRRDSTSSDLSESLDNLQARLKNVSFDAARQRKLNKTLQTDNETLSKNLQSLTEKLTHSERDIASKRTLIENYKSRLSEMETMTNHSSDKTSNENNEERMKSLAETMDKLRVSLDSYKTRLQTITREKQTLETRYAQLLDEHQKLKTRCDEIQSKHRLNEQQLKQMRTTNDQLTQELSATRRLSEQQYSSFNMKSQESLTKLNLELDRTRRRSNEYERFINAFLHEMIRRSVQMTEQLHRVREHQRHRESMSMTLPGYDSAITTASKILNLTQDDLDEIMSTTDDSFQMANKHDGTTDKNERFRQKLSKILLSQEECASKLLKMFTKKLDEIQAADRQLAIVRTS